MSLESVIAVVLNLEGMCPPTRNAIRRALEELKQNDGLADRIANELGMSREQLTNKLENPFVPT